MTKVRHLLPLFCLAAVAARAQELQLHGLFGDHMVLPQQTTVAVRGRADAGAALELAAPWLPAPVRATAAADGSFALALPTPAAGGPFQVTVRSDRGAVRALDDVLVGDVWLGSGQSNMEMAVGRTSWSPGTVDWEREVAAADLPRLRLFTFGHRVAATPHDDVDGLGHWQVCTPATAASFSATAFYFGRALERQRAEPLGLVVACWGGTICEAWTRREGLTAFPEFAPALAALTGGEAALTARRAAFWAAVAASDPRPAGRRAEDPAADVADWAVVQQPHRWREPPLDGFDGVGWYRRTVPVPAAWRGRELLLQLGPIDDLDTVFVDGRRLAGTEEQGHWQAPRDYRVPAAMVGGETMVIAVRVVDTGGLGGFFGTAEAMRLAPADGGDGALALAGAWRFLRGAALADLPPWPRPLDGEPNHPSVLWNGMIAPLQSFPFRGAIWYQGESNRERADQYARLFPAMIADWRRAFGRELPFLFVQIAPYGYRGDRGELSALRTAQEAALLLPATGMAASIDVGEVADIHPRQKRTIGERLARLALARVHGDEAVAAEAVRVATVRRDGDCVRIAFAAHGALRSGDGGPRHFELAGEDGVFAAVVAAVEGAEVVLRGAAVAAARRVRYCHAATAIGDLWDAADQPVLPFVLAIPE